MYLSESYKNRLKKLSGIIAESVTTTIQELDSEDVSIPASYIKDSLNPKIWDGDKLKPEIREHLLKIAVEYVKYLEINIEPERVMFLGSMANYNWNESSDFDLHIVYDFKKISDDKDFVKDFFDTKGSNWKNSHKISLKGHDVEVYVQEKDEENKSVGVYDLKNDNWISEPKREDVKIDKELIKKKAASIATRIEDIEKMSKEDSNWDKIHKEAKKLKDKIKKMRQAGLDESGEFSAENLAFKYLRNNGYLERLGNISSKAFDNNLSMNEAEHNIDPKYLKKVIFKSKRRPDMIITVTKTPDGKIVEIDNQAGVRFPYNVGQTLDMGHQTWACNNNFTVNDKDTCPEEKVFGIKKSDIPQGHELRTMFPGKFRNESINEDEDILPEKEEQEIKRIAKKGKLNIAKYNMDELVMGYRVEKEHGTVNPITNITNDDDVKTIKIALAHLNEVPDYYTKLAKYVETDISESLNESVEHKNKPKHRLIIKKSVDNMTPEKIELFKKFIVFCFKELDINEGAKIFLTGERGGPITTTASFNPNNHEIWIYVKNRNLIVDPMRSTAHEIRHLRQELDGEITDDSGLTGSPIENEANAFGGIAIRKFGKLYPEIYK